MSDDAEPVAGNRLLAALTAADAAALSPHLQPVGLAAGEVLYRPGDHFEHVYFPRSTGISVLTLLADGTVVEGALVGREGMVGLPLFLGDDRSRAMVICQIPGVALRMDAEAFRAEIGPAHPLSDRLRRYTVGRMIQISQGAACNRRHGVAMRCATWLLLAADAVAAESFPLTQRFLSIVLGVRRATVAEAAAALQRAGLIRYRLGNVAIVDRPGLEAAACECYAVIRDEFARLLA